MSPLLSRFLHQSSLSPTPWAKTERRAQVRPVLLTKAASEQRAAGSSSSSWEKTGTFWILLPWMPQTRRPVQACEITHSYVNNKRTNWQNCRLGLSAKWPADKTEVSLQVQRSSDNAAHVFKPRHKINRPTMNFKFAESTYIIRSERPIEPPTQINQHACHLYLDSHLDVETLVVVCVSLWLHTHTFSDSGLNTFEFWRLTWFF